MGKESEGAVTGGLSKPSDLAEVKALNEKVTTFDKVCLDYLKVLEAAEAASKKMTSHAEADSEVAALKDRYNKVKGVSEEWVKKGEEGEKIMTVQSGGVGRRV